jgi:hypothetical protein
MNIIPPLTPEQCQLIVDRSVQLTERAVTARARYRVAEADINSIFTVPVDAQQQAAALAGMLSAAQWAEQEAAAGQLLALLALHQLDLTKGAKLA